MDFSTLKGLTIPEGVVTKITSGNVVLWERPSIKTAFNLICDFAADSTFGADYAQSIRIWEYTPDGEEVMQDMEWQGYTAGNTIEIACEEGNADISNYTVEWRMYNAAQTSYEVFKTNDFYASFVMPAHDVKIEVKVTLVNTECVHEYVYQYTQDPTCIAYGYDVYRCSKCGEYAYYNYTEPSDDKHEYSIIESENASCESAGYNKYRCTLCGHEYLEITENAYGHDWRPDWQEVEGGHAHICDRCGAESEVKSHNWGSWIGEDMSGHYRVCQDCGAVDGGHAHEWTGTVLEEANCTHGTYYSFDCYYCGYHYGKWYEGDPLGHSPGRWQDGGDSCVKYCTRCGELLETQSHNWVKEDEKSWYCSNCGAVREDEEEITCAHNWVQEDEKTKYCTICGLIVENNIDQ